LIAAAQEKPEADYPGLQKALSMSHFSRRKFYAFGTLWQVLKATMTSQSGHGLFGPGT